MRLTDIKVTKIEQRGSEKAVASIVIDNEICVKGIKVIEGKNGLFIVMPSRRIPNGEYKDFVHPINTETREKIQNAIIEEYKQIN